MPTLSLTPTPERQSPIRQESLTVLARVDREAPLRATLDALGASAPSVFADPELGIHFARLVVIPKDGDQADSSVWLAFESNFDTPFSGEVEAQAAHLDALSARARDTLAEIFGCCSGFPAAGSPEPAGHLAAYLKAGLVPSTASYQGHSHRSIARIRLERDLREIILTYLETANGCGPEQLFERVRDHVRALSKTDPRLAGLDVDQPAPPLPDPVVRSQHLSEGWAPWIEAGKLKDTLPILLNLPKALLEWQKHDAVFDVREHQERWTDADREAFSAIARSEDHGTQNALTHVVPLREGSGRLTVLKHAHATVNRISQNHFQYIGQLGTIPSIHFAKWLLFESDRRLLFFSNYDKSWESYLGDFVDRAPEGLNLAWSCTREYPRTVAFAFEGAKDEETFKSWTRAYQVPTQFFYSAYTDLTIETINNNTWIRTRLHDAPSAGGLDAWLRRLT
jgi:hypothetical protein